jgi:toxin-antitoxin system PIN domain toxin
MTRYLLDVNALIALGFREHDFHAPVATWVRKLNSGDELVTCAITELGFVRVLAQLPQAELSIDEAKNILQRLKSVGSVLFTFVADDHDASRLPGWVKTPKQTTDGHLAELAKAHGAKLATLDRSVPGAFLIPPKI